MKTSQMLTSVQMAKMVSLMEPLKNLSVAEIAREMKLSATRISTFKKAREDDLNSPAYMVGFWAIVEATGAIGAAKEYDKAREAANKTKEAKEDTRPVSAGSMETITGQRMSLSGRRFVFTSAQNNTEVHKTFLASLLRYCDHNDARLIIGRFAYNKNGFQNGVTEDDEMWYSPELQEYFLLNNEKDDAGALIGDTAVWCGELNILPTAKYPLSGLEQYTGGLDTIVPASKIALESVATLAGQDAKLMYSTGTVTLRNYIQKKGGQLAESEHNYGALVVEVDANGSVHVRQIETDDSGNFYDLDCFYTPDLVTSGNRVFAINWGDLHSEKSDETALDTCFSIRDYLEPENQFFHDSFDMTSRNHHNRKSGHFLMQQMVEGGTVDRDLAMAASIMQRFDNGSSRCIVVESNHDLALESWLDCNIYSFQNDPQNARAYLALQSAKYDSLYDQDSDFNLLEFAITKYANVALTPVDWDNWQFMQVDESFKAKGIEYGMHGHIGANGSRGAPKQFRKLAMKVNTGHTHTASIHGNVYTAGVTGALNMGYNKGPSSWSHSHIVTYANGFRTIITQRCTEWNGGLGIGDLADMREIMEPPTAPDSYRKALPSQAMLDADKDGFTYGGDMVTEAEMLEANTGQSMAATIFLGEGKESEIVGRVNIDKPSHNKSESTRSNKVGWS